MKGWDIAEKRGRPLGAECNFCCYSFDLHGVWVYGCWGLDLDCINLINCNNAVAVGQVTNIDGPAICVFFRSKDSETQRMNLTLPTGLENIL